MPTIYFGMGFTERRLPLPSEPFLDEHSFDGLSFLAFLEGYYGFLPETERQEFLRIEKFRQLLRDDHERNPNAFYRASFLADPLATAEHVLGMRDELIAAGYPLHQQSSPDCPERISCLHRLENQLLLSEAKPDNGSVWTLGAADRLRRLLAALEAGKHPALWVRVHEPFQLLDPGSKRLLKALHNCGDFVQYMPSPPPPTTQSILGRWQAETLHAWNRDREAGEFPQAAAARPHHSFIERWVDEGQVLPKSWTFEDYPNVDISRYRDSKLPTDDSLIIIKSFRETHIAAFLARLLQVHPDWKPALLMAKKRQTFDLAMRMEGLPSMGVPSTSLARPSLQVLKLIPTFLWEPVNLRKLHEFLKLTVKPLDRRLGYRLASAMSDNPGLFSESWFTASRQFFEEELPRLVAKDKRISAETIEDQYNFWFRRARYPIDGRAPKSEVRKLFVFVVNWVQSRTEEDKDDVLGLQTLSAQAKRAVELIDQMDETELNSLQVDRIVRTVYEAAPAKFQEEQQNSLPAAFHPAAVCGEVPELIWWDFVQEEPDYFFSSWLSNELDYLGENGIELLSPEAKNQRQIWSRTRPLLFTRERMVLCFPQQIAGNEVSAHPLYGELEAIFGEQLDDMTIDLDADVEPAFLDWSSPSFSELGLRPLASPKPFVKIAGPERIRQREQESPTSLERFIYHPHQWVFPYGLLIKASRQPELRLGTRLRGLLAHRFMERIFAEDKPLEDWTKAELNQWIARKEPDILSREGGMLLEYGYEPDRVQFRRQVQRAAWALICSLRDNGWASVQSEIDLEGQIGDLVIKSRADLLAQAEDGSQAILDLKWRGKTRYRNLLRNREEIQLSLYAQLLEQASNGPVFSGYFLLSEAQALARTSHIFSDAELVDPDADPRQVRSEILEKLQHTYAWRKQQMTDGLLEIRCNQTLAELEDAYRDMDYEQMLEMKEANAPFDDYRALIGLVD
ncbi:MAG: PD-(D/E)XK nuclease family protein [Bacteroidota bacterium]